MKQEDIVTVTNIQKSLLESAFVKEEDITGDFLREQAAMLRIWADITEDVAVEYDNKRQ